MDAAPADPLPALWLEWQWLRGLLDDLDVTTEGPEGEALYQEVERVGALLRSTTATTAEGVRAQFEYMAADILEDGDGCSSVPEVVTPLIAVFRAGLARL